MILLLRLSGNLLMFPRDLGSFFCMTVKPSARRPAQFVKIKISLRKITPNTS